MPIPLPCVFYVIQAAFIFIAFLNLRLAYKDKKRLGTSFSKKDLVDSTVLSWLGFVCYGCGLIAAGMMTYGVITLVIATAVMVFVGQRYGD